MSPDNRFEDTFVPALAGDFIRMDIDGETIVWSEYRPVPTLLDAVAAVMLGVVDGSASVMDLTADVHDEIGIALDVARTQIERIVALFDLAGLLETSSRGESAVETIRKRRLFVNPVSH